MRIGLSIFFLFFGNWAHAYIPSADLMNLNYYTHPGKFEIVPRITSAMHDMTMVSSGGSTNMSYNEFYLALVYGFAPRFRVGISDTFMWDRENDDSTGATETNSISQGFSNPTMEVTWRFLEMAKEGLSAEFGVFANPSFGDKLNANGTAGQTGNNLSGNAAAGATVNFFWRCLKNEVELSSSASDNFVSHQDGVAATGTTTTDAHWTSSVTLLDRFHFSPSFYTQLGAVGTLPYSTAVADAAGNSRSNSMPFFVNYRVSFGIRAEKSVVFDVSFSYQQYTYANFAAAGETDFENTQALAIVSMQHEF